MKEIKVVWAPWCSQCGPFKQALTKAGVGFEPVNADENMELCQQYGVRSLPTTLIFEDGDLVKTVIGNKVQEVLS